MVVKRINITKTKAAIKAKTDAIQIGGRYFLSVFYDSDGYWVKVLDKSTKINKCGWPSTVSFEILEVVGTSYRSPSRVPGYTGTCNATNLYSTREAAAHTPAKAAAMIAALGLTKYASRRKAKR